MKTIIFLAILASASAQANLSEVLDLPNNRISLDALTRSSETLNKAKVLHLGKTSRPVRHELIKNAKNNVFITVPYWFKDESGKAMMDEVRSAKERNPKLDIRVMEDFVSPASTKDFFGLKQYRDLKKILGKKNVIQWNKLWNFKRFSVKLWSNRMHDKLMVVDGQKLLMGGMNMGDDYLLGGVDRRGWHDTDILFEGPVALQGSEIFLKPFLFQEYSDEVKSETARGDYHLLKVLQYFFYFNKDKVSFGSGNVSTFQVPFRAFYDNKKYFPKHEAPTPEHDVPVRLIYENPLVDRLLIPQKGGGFETKRVSRLLNTLEFMLPYVKTSIRMFIPYPTLSDRMTKIITDAAKKGIKVEIITNSLASHDLGPKFYKAGLPRVRQLIEAGATVHEWQGHKSLEQFEKDHGCTIEGYWPGNRLHTKAIIIDNEVALIGSHNLNVRSEKHNSEITALVRSPRIARELDDIFEYDLDKGEKTVKCGGEVLSGRPPRTRQVDLEELKDLYDFKDLEKLKKYYDFI